MFRKLGIVTSCLALFGSLAMAASYEIDGVHSSAVFKVKHFGVSNFYGTFGKMSGTIRYDADNVGASSIEISIDAESVASRSSQRDTHIKSPDFLDVKQFPKITFKSKSVKGSGDKLEVTGDLTLHGVTNEIKVTAAKTGEGSNPMSKKDIVGFEARFTVDRTQFDMSYMVGPLSKEIEFVLALEAAKN